MEAFGTLAAGKKTNASNKISKPSPPCRNYIVVRCVHHTHFLPIVNRSQLLVNPLNPSLTPSTTLWRSFHVFLHILYFLNTY